VIRGFASCLALLFDGLRLLFYSREALMAENMFLRLQLGLYEERNAARHW
jgi:hypothetical protein